MVTVTVVAGAPVALLELFEPLPSGLRVVSGHNRGFFTLVRGQRVEWKFEVECVRRGAFDVERGRLPAVMGPSGSGKSTLLHILAGLDKPSTGSVTVAGKEITTLGDSELTKLRREHIGFVFQFFNLLPMLNAEENILLPLTIAGVKPDRARLDELIRSVGLGDRLHHRPSELAGGQQPSHPAGGVGLEPAEGEAGQKIPATVFTPGRKWKPPAGIG